MNIELSGEFCFSEGPWLTWTDLRFGMSRGYISAKGVVEFATDSLALTSDENHYDLAAMSGADRWDVDGCLERLELFAEPDISNRKDHWLYLILLWVYNNQLLYDDPLTLAEDIYAEFGYPESMAPMIRYMPSEHDDIETRSLVLAANLADGLRTYGDLGISKDQMLANVQSLVYTGGEKHTSWMSGFNAYQSVAGDTSQPHEYKDLSTACIADRLTSCGTPAVQFDSLRRYAGPGASGDALADNGAISQLNVLFASFGNVTHLIDPSTSSLINITVPGAHVLEPGFVVRQVIPDGDGGFSVKTEGWGTGKSPADNSNVWAAGALWGINTHGIGQDAATTTWPFSPRPAQPRCASSVDSQGQIIKVCQ